VSLRLPAFLRRGGSRRPPAPFIVGVGHSGTTLLRLMLDAHPELTVPPETNFLPELFDLTKGGSSSPEEVIGFLREHRRWGDFGLDPDELEGRLRSAGRISPRVAARCFYDLYAEKQGKARWGDKSPRYAAKMVKIGRFLPEARFIHLIRDGRDVALSRLKRRGDDPEQVREMAVTWRSRIERARKRSPKVSHYTEARFEELVTDTEPTLRRLCEFSELDWDPAVLSYHERSEERLAEMAHALPAKDGRERNASEEVLAERRAKRHQLVTEPPKAERLAVWKRKMTPECLAAFEGEAGPLLRELGYELGARAASARD
jgi:Sulfotransferase family